MDKATLVKQRGAVRTAVSKCINRRNSFRSSKRVRHTSDRHIGYEFDYTEISALDETLDDQIESKSFDSAWRLEANLRRTQSMRETSVRTRENTENGKKKKKVNTMLAFLHRVRRIFSDSTELQRIIVCSIVAIVTALIFTGLLLTNSALVSVKHKLFRTFIDASTRWNANASLVIPGWITINLLIATIGIIIVYLIEPRSGGSGVPELRAFINGISVPRGVHFRSLVARLIGMVITTTAELPLGQSEPFMYVGGAVAAGISQGRSSTFSLDFKIFRKFRNNAEMRDFVTAGATAGFCAAFGTPLAAVLYMMEELATHWTQAGVWRVMWTSMVTSVTVITVGTFWQPRDAGIGSAMFGQIPAINMPLLECGMAIIIGFIGGLVGVLFRLLNRAVNRVRSHYKTRRFRIVEMMALSIFSVCCSMPLLWFEGDRHCYTLNPSSSDAFVSTIRTPCPDGQTNSIGLLLLQMPSRTFRSLIHEPSWTFSPITTMLFAIYSFFGAALMYGCNLPGGIILPNLIIGAAWGRVLGQATAFLFGNASEVLCIEKFALFGAASQTAAVLGVFLTIPMMFVEATQSIEVGMVIAISVLVGKATAEFFSSSDFYTMWSRILQFAFLPAEPDENVKHAIGLLRASDVMSNPVTFVRTTETVGNLLSILQNTNYNGFPVVSNEADEYSFGRLRGFIDRTILMALLEYKDLYTGDTNARSIYLDDDIFRRTTAPTLEMIQENISEEDLDRRVIVADYMCIAPHVVQMHMSFLRVYAMFRTLGLRHLPVVTAKNNVVGIITRKDLLRYRWRHGKLMECEFVRTID